ncbi:MAG: RNA pseudouridine synthase [bacterium]|nr:RNA pseudouridine synthase [bacterium]
MEPKIIYENKDVAVINKPAGLLVHDDGKGSEETLVDWLRVNFPEVATVGDDPAERPGIVHRLDKDTSGIMLIPRTQAYFEYLKDLFQQKRIKKTYWAVVKGSPRKDEGVISSPISIKPGTIKRTTHGGKMTKEAVTSFRVLRRLDGYCLIEASPKTGRTHQIRVHLASIGSPVLGDTLYGSKKNKEEVPRQMLHARGIEFQLEPGKSVRLVADPPDDFQDALADLEK